ncbi:MAG: cysteine--tRNA ligase [Candidatus Bathyarchaeota archaeon]|nr:MAG: cysteine--tRNA ligase [Candidatus Bathyarchaeota archaeon]
MVLKLVNTMSGKKEIFKPLEEGRVKIFVCGMTDYDYMHLGHGRTYAFYDLLTRFLKFLGYKIYYIQNITDVGHLREDTGEDRVAKKAAEEKKAPMEVVDFYMRKNLEAADRLRLERPNILARATGHLIEIIEQVDALLKNGYAYEANGSVYFDVTKFRDYGKLSKRALKKLRKGARVETHSDKKDPRDFALWIKAPKDHMLKWSSPWGLGYPGWHIEDTAIAMKYFGSQYDIHGGAIDLIFPHHEAEIAQAEGITGVEPYVRYWIHTGMLTINGEPMSKSRGNYIKLLDALAEHSPEALRLWMASSDYRKPLDYSRRNIEDAEKNVKKISNVMELIDEKTAKPPKKRPSFVKDVQRIEKQFIEHMENDVDTPHALATFWELISLINKQIDENEYSKEDLETARETIVKLGGFFQIIPEKKKEIDEKMVEGLMDFLVELRQKFREEKDYETSDTIRRKLRGLGIAFEDTAEGVKWRIKARKT